MTESDFGEKIKEQRKKKNFTQEQLADLVGVSKNSISNYERGCGFPDYVTLKKLHGIFGVSYDYFFEIDEDDELCECQNYLMRMTRSERQIMVKVVKLLSELMK